MTGTRSPSARVARRPPQPAAGPIAAGPIDGIEPGTLTARGQRTRARLLVAARQVFERRGYQAARVSDISRAARVAHGTFYTYFDSKRDVLRHVVDLMQYELQTSRPAAPPGLTPIERIEHANRNYYEVFRRHARMIGILEELPSFDELWRARRGEMRAEATDRAATAIVHWQDQGLVDPTLDAHYVAAALVSMVDRTLYVWLVLGEPFDEDKILTTLNTLCARALGLEPNTV